MDLLFKNSEKPVVCLSNSSDETETPQVATSVAWVLNPIRKTAGRHLLKFERVPPGKELPGFERVGNLLHVRQPFQRPGPRPD